MRQPFKNRPELEVGTNLYNLRLTPFFPVVCPLFAPRQSNYKAIKVSGAFQT